MIDKLIKYHIAILWLMVSVGTYATATTAYSAPVEGLLLKIAAGVFALLGIKEYIQEVNNG